MAGRRRRNSISLGEALTRASFALILLAALGLGGIKNFVPALITIVIWLLGCVVLGGIAWLLLRRLRRRRPDAGAMPTTDAPAESPVETFDLSRQVHLHTVRVVWTAAEVEAALAEIDWFQFEKFCEALLRAEGFQVERKGGAHPDGGVDLVVSKGGLSALIQCKHWKTSQVQEKVVRELLGSMTHFGVNQAAIFCLKGGTEPAKVFAAQHDIDIVDEKELGKRAVAMLGTTALNQILDSNQKHCPKCEAPMIERNGRFGSFWGCSRYPQCRGKLEAAKVA